VVAAAFAAIALFVVSWTLLHVGFYTHKQLIDTPVYQRYGNAIADGKVPYRDFAVEYPPGALPVFALPGLAEPGRNQEVSTGFRRSFETLMWLCGAAALAAMAVVLRTLRRSTVNVWAALCLAAIAPLLLGSVILSRFDLWPAALVAAALAALVSGRLRLGHALLGLGVAAKLYPAVFVPLGVAFVWKRAGRREALTCLALGLGVVAAVFAPFVILSPGGVWQSLSVQLTRPLQVESLGSALLLVGHHVFGVGVTGETSHGSQNLAGSAADWLELLSTVLQAGVLIWIWAAFARGRGDAEALVRSTRGLALCVHRLREGPVAAVHDLADSDRAARAWPPRARSERVTRRRARPDADLVPVSLLQALAQLRSRAFMVVARARPDAGRSRCDARGHVGPCGRRSLVLITPVRARPRSSSRARPRRTRR